MPVAPTYPGVYVEELPSGVRTVVGVSTSVTAFIGRSSRGDVNRAKVINNYGDFERQFGGLWVDSTLGFAVKDFYMNGGSQAVIVRLFHPYFESETEQVEALAAAQAIANAANSVADTANTEATAAVVAVVAGADADIAGGTATPASVAAAARAVATAETDEPRVSASDTAATAAENAVSADGATPESVLAAIEANREAAISAGLMTVAGSVATAARDAVNSLAGPTAIETEAAETVAAAGEAAAALPDATAETVRAAINQAVGEAAPLTKARLSANGLNLEAATEGAWGNQLQARIDHDVIGPDAAILFNLSVRDGSTGDVEVFRNVSVQPDHPRNVEQVLINGSMLVRVRGTLPGSRPGTHPTPAIGENIWGDNTPATHIGVALTDQSSDGSTLNVNDFTGPGTSTNKQGLYALEQTDLFNLLCIPPYLPDGNVDIGLIASAASYCEQKRAMYIVDPPSTWMSKDAAKGDGTTTGLASLGLTSSYAALFFPRLRQPNPLKDNQIESFAPCGTVAGVFARTDAQRGVWKAPAGLDAGLRGVPGLTVNLTDAENGELNPLGINCLRVFPAAGRVVWGARTMAGDDRLASQWKYVPVRRLALYIEESLFRGLKWVVFEPNDEPLWAQIRLNVGAFMQNLFRQGAFQGSTPREAYLVKCDRETTTQNDINLGIVNIVVGFAPLKPAEFVILKIQQLAGQLEV